MSFILESCPVDLRAHGAAWSALDCAADAGQAEACELLISKGAKIGSTCLARCVLHRNRESMFRCCPRAMQLGWFVCAPRCACLNPLCTLACLFCSQ